MYTVFKKDKRKSLRLIFSQSAIINLNENHYNLANLYSFEEFFYKINENEINSRKGIAKLVIDNELVINSLIRFDSTTIQIGAINIPIYNVVDSLENRAKILWIEKNSN